MENSNVNVNGGLQFFNATGARQPKAINEDVIIAESTRASFKIMPSVAAKLGIKDGDCVTMQITKDENGVATGVYIGKGKNHVYETDAEGNFVMGDRNRKKIAKEGFGSTVAESTPGTNVLKVSVAAAWDVVGNEDLKKVYELSAEPIAVSLPIGNGEFFSTDLYKLEFVKDEPKAERIGKAKVSTDAVAVQGSAPEQEAIQPTQEAQVSETPASFENDEF